ncbi:MAG: Fe-S protein assembly co-chaperone HscB [Pseudomonadota bacterium]
MTFEQNYFQLLSLPVAFDVDASALQAAYLTLQTQFHPDRFVNATSQEQRLSVQFIAHLNEAKQCLEDDVKRGYYLLELLHETVPEERTIDDMEFLMAQMELREQGEALVVQGDADALRSFQQSIQAQYEELRSHLSSQLADALWNDAAVSLAKLQFFQKLSNEVSQANKVN